MSIFEYNEEEHMRSLREEGREEGREQGIEEKGIQVFNNLLKHGFSKEEAQKLADIPDELVTKVFERISVDKQ